MGALVSIARELQSGYRAEPPLDRDRAHQELVTLAKKRAADDVAMLEPLLVAAETRVHEVLGLGSFHEYCARLFGWGGRQTRERLRVARAMRELPRLRERWAAGELSYTVVRELTRVATPEVEGEWLEWASPEGGERRTGHEAQRMTAKHVRGDRPSDPPAPFSEQRVRVVFEVSGSEAARLGEVRAEATRRLGHSVDDRTLLKMLFDGFLRGERSDADPGAAAAEVRLTVCERCGATERESGGEGLVEVDPVIGEAARCDARVVREGERARQTVSPALRRRVVGRDQGVCAAPGCRQSAFVEVHHVERRADGGAHEEENLVCLCSVHHDLVHRGRLVVRSAEGGFTFERADGSAYGAVGSRTDEVVGCQSLAAAFVRVADGTGSEFQARKVIDARLGRCEAIGPAGPMARDREP